MKVRLTKEAARRIVEAGTNTRNVSTQTIARPVRGLRRQKTEAAPSLSKSFSRALNSVNVETANAIASVNVESQDVTFTALTGVSINSNGYLVFTTGVLSFGGVVRIETSSVALVSDVTTNDDNKLTVLTNVNLE